MIQEIKKAVNVLNNGGVILYPTDTVWGIGCDARNSIAINKIYKIKNRKSEKTLICLMEDIKMLKKHILNIPKEAELLINGPIPATIIYDNPKNISKILIADDNTLAVRIPEHEFCNKLLSIFGKPIVSTSANLSGQETPLSFSEITKSILEGVDHVVNLQKEKKALNMPSKIFKVGSNGEILTIRK